MPQSGSRALIFPSERKWSCYVLCLRQRAGYRIAIWSQSKWIVAFLVLLIIGHWSLILQGISVFQGCVGLTDQAFSGVLIGASWVPGMGCQITYSNTTILAATFMYSMCFDLVVMCLSAYKLAWIPARNGTKGSHTRLIRMLFSDGLIYFFIAYVFYIYFAGIRSTHLLIPGSCLTQSPLYSWYSN